MKKIISIVSAAAIVALAFSSCRKEGPKGNETPITPEQKIENIIPDKIELAVHGGHLHGTSFHGNPSFMNVAFPMKNKAVLTFELQSDGKTFRQKENTPLRLVAHTVWSSEITFMDKENNRLNAHYTTKGMEDLCQFFVTAENMRQYTPGASSEGAPISKPLEQVMSGFVYRDTDPEHLMYNPHGGHKHEGDKHDHDDKDHEHTAFRHEGAVKLSQKNVGFKGYFHNPATEAAEQFIGVREQHVAFDLVYHLVRFATPNDKMRAGQYRSAFAWEQAFSALTVCSFKVPVRIVTQHPKDEAAIKTYLSDIAKEFNLSESEVETMYDESFDIPIEGKDAEHYHM